ncbi:hypothetical protein L6Q79_04505 [bacterium]|nr:hypothetical protein [bacterium]NUN44199.1 hypothetical protein [bacterium]
MKQLQNKIEVTADELFEQFVRELENYSTNGVVRSFETDRLWPLAQHYIAQCAPMQERMDLEERIRLLLASKYQYTLQESRLKLSENLEQSIKEKIRALVKSNIENAGKFAALAFNWTVLKPLQFAKDILQPVATNAMLTYAVAIQPSFTPAMDAIKLESKIQASHVEVADEIKTDFSRVYELPSVKTYSNEDLNAMNAGANTLADEKAPIIQKNVNKTYHITPVQSSLKETSKLTIDVERARLIPETIPSVTSSPVSYDRTRRELRSIGEVQQTIGLHENKIFSCYQSYRKTSNRKNGRVAVKFLVSSKGVIKDVQVTANSFNRQMADRIVVQLKAIKFSEVESRHGDQTIYHTFYF